MGHEIDKGPAFGMRHVQSLLLFVAITVVYFSRWNISVSVVAMTNAEKTNPDFEEFDWNEKELSYILSSFYWGYIVTQIPGGVLCKRYGAKLIMSLSIFVSALLSVLTPWCVSWGGWQALCAIRICQGLSQGPVFPCVFDHMAKWYPSEERNRLGAFNISAINFGSVLAMISGIIAESSMGWPGISYVSAGFCLVCSLLWWIFGANNPRESRFIVETEKNYIETSLAHDDDFHQNKITVPWKAVFTSVPFIMFLVVSCGETWGMTTMMAQIPAYMNGVLNMDIRSNALFSALPFLAAWFSSYVYLLLADMIRHKNLLSLIALRRVFNTVAYWAPAIGFIGVGFLDENNKGWAVALLTVIMAVNSGMVIGSSLNIIDLSPNHSGVLYSVVNALTSGISIITPLVAGAVVTESSNRSQWQIVFAITAAILFFVNLFYIIFGSAEAQPWDAADFLLPKDMESSASVCDGKISSSEVNGNDVECKESPEYQTKIK